LTEHIKTQYGVHNIKKDGEMNRKRMKRMENFLAYFIAVIHFGIKYECKCYWYKDLRNPRNNRKLDGSYDPKESGRSKILIDDHLIKNHYEQQKLFFMKAYTTHSYCEEKSLMKT